MLAPVVSYSRLPAGVDGAVPEGAGPHKFGTLAATSDVCNRFPSQKLPLSVMYKDRTKSRISGGFRPKHGANIPICEQGDKKIGVARLACVRGGRESRLALSLVLA